MKPKSIILTVCIALFILGVAIFILNNRSVLNHSFPVQSNILTEAGNDAFGTIQEVIKKLDNNLNTDWNKIDLEALRKHLQDMNDMTLNIEVISQTPIANGLESIVQPTTKRASFALERVFAAHPVQLKIDTGWDMKVIKNNNQYTLVTTSENPEDIPKIRGLGYIGLMAYGNHHQPHHWAITTGDNPHNY